MNERVAAAVALLLVGAGLLAAHSKMFAVAANGPLTINIWYGEEQRFGRRGIPQRWVNILGSVAPAEQVTALSYSLNGGAARQLSIGQDKERLAAPGDFNIELDHQKLKAGNNQVVITATDKAGQQTSQIVTVHFTPDRKWPLPYAIDWRKVKKIQDAVQVVDGLWRLDGAGIRTARPWYDRVVAVGDLTWTDYEVTVEVTFHNFAEPRKEPPTYGVTHAGIGLRWQGHHDDGRQPRVKWYPLGAATEFQLFPNLTDCHWRILPDGGDRRAINSTQRTAITLGKTYLMKACVESLPDKQTRYRTKLWAAAAREPDEWAVESTEGTDDFQAGCLLLVAHNSDVTFGHLKIIPLNIP
ncbi:MAG: hypothetical protein ACREEM_01570 [Blastocatellia bacterium]